MFNALVQAPWAIGGDLVGWRWWGSLAAAAWQVFRPCSNVELGVLRFYLPAIGGAVGLDGVEDGNTLDGQRARVRHPPKRDRVACCSFDVEDLERHGGLTALANVELDEGGEGRGAGCLTGEEVDAVGEVGEVDVEDVGRTRRVEGAVDEEREVGDKVVHIFVLQAVAHAGIVVTEGSPATFCGEGCGEDGGEEGRGGDKDRQGVHT
jgi:hypothetical protein